MYLFIRYLFTLFTHILHYIRITEIDLFSVPNAGIRGTVGRHNKPVVGGNHVFPKTPFLYGEQLPRGQQERRGCEIATGCDQSIRLRQGYSKVVGTRCSRVALDADFVTSLEQEVSFGWRSPRYNRSLSCLRTGSPLREHFARAGRQRKRLGSSRCLQLS